MAELSLDALEIGVTLGTGSFGRVRFARFQEDPQKVCALKILKKSEIVRLQQVEHIMAERTLLFELNNTTDTHQKHPFIINFYGSFQDDKFLYIAMEYINGGEFFTHLRKLGRMEIEQAKFYTGSVVSMFEYLHSGDIIYRDLKPENLLLDHRGYMKLTDFGFAKRVAFKTYTLCGTPEYIAPEVLLNKGHGKGVDWWTVGILLYEIICGQPPFVDDDPMGIYQQVLAGRVTFPRYYDRAAKSLTRKLLNADLTKRFGCLKNGAGDIKNHKYFVGFDFGALVRHEIEPPITPTVTGPDDTSNYDPYPDTVSEIVPFYAEDDPFKGFNSVVV